MDLQNNQNSSPASAKNTETLKLSFYKKHFPTDRENFSQRIAALGFICSVLSTLTFMDEFLFYQTRYTFPFMLLSFGAAFQLYCGLRNGDRKQFTPWIILKFVELLAVIIDQFILYFRLSDRFPYNHKGGFSVRLGIPRTVLTIVNIWIFSVVVAKSLRMMKTTTRICGLNSSDNGDP